MTEKGAMKTAFCFQVRSPFARQSRQSSKFFYAPFPLNVVSDQPIVIYNPLYFSLDTETFASDRKNHGSLQAYERLDHPTYHRDDCHIGNWGTR